MKKGVADKGNSKKAIKIVHIKRSYRSQRTHQPYSTFGEENDDIIRPTSPFQSQRLHLQPNDICKTTKTPR